MRTIGSRFASLLAAAVLGAASPARGQAPPSTDVYLAPITRSGRAEAGIAIGNAMNVSRRAGYDNQPAFMADERAVFYTSVRGDGQADIYRYDIGSRRTTRVTATPESEYSATLAPGGSRFTVIRVEPDSTQRLWSFRLDGSDPELVLRTIKPVGYHAWLDANRVAVFVLGNPATLQVVDRRTEHADIVARDIGRSLSSIAPDQISFVVRRPDRTFMLERLTVDSASGRSTVADVAPLPQGAEYVVWTPDGRALTASGSRIFVLEPRSSTWVLAADLSGQRIAHISRLAVSPNGHWLACVADDGP